MHPNPRNNTPKQSGDITATNVSAGRDFTQVNNSIQEISETPAKIPVETTETNNRWIELFTYLFSSTAIPRDALHNLFRMVFLVSFVVMIATLVAVIPNYTPLLHAGYPLAPELFVPLLVFSGFGLAITREYFLARDDTDCPACNEPFALRTTAMFEYPEYSTATLHRGERTVTCASCGYHDTQQTSWQPQPVDTDRIPRD